MVVTARDTSGCRAIAVSLYAGRDSNGLRYGAGEAAACARQLSHDYEVERILPNDILMDVRR